jgi:hypothetical protein
MVTMGLVTWIHMNRMSPRSSARNMETVWCVGRGSILSAGTPQISAAFSRSGLAVTVP